MALICPCCLPVAFPHSSRANGLYLLLLINLHNLTTHSNKVYLFFGQRIFSSIQSITHHSCFTSHCLPARGTHLVCSMGALYQVIKGHKGGNTGVPPPHLPCFPSPRKFGLIFTSCQTLYLSNTSSPSTRPLTILKGFLLRISPISTLFGRNCSDSSKSSLILLYYLCTLDWWILLGLHHIVLPSPTIILVLVLFLIRW
jgi:hypothetical protein